MAPLKRSKTDANDAAAIREAVTRPSMRFVAIKTKEQQAALMLQRAPSTPVFVPKTDVPPRPAEVRSQSGIEHFARQVAIRQNR